MQTATQIRALDEAQATELPVLLQALWHESRGDWELAHGLAQEEDGPQGAWVHAYLHRREGDAANAAYWYRRAAKPVCTLPFAAEWDALVTALLRSQEGV